MDCREGCTFTYSNGKAWLIGGIGERVISKIVSFDPKTFEFEQMKAEKCSRMPRFNHTSIAFNGQIYIYGGERYSNTAFSSKTVSSDMVAFQTGNLKIYHL